MKKFDLKKLTKKGKKIAKKIIKYIKTNKKEIINSFILIMPFIIMDLFTRINNNINYYKFYYLTPNLFSLLYIILIYFITNCCKGKLGKIFYSIIFMFYFSIFLINNIY